MDKVIRAALLKKIIENLTNHYDPNKLGKQRFK
jgi:hypothetical protein